MRSSSAATICSFFLLGHVWALFVPELAPSIVERGHPGFRPPQWNQPATLTKTWPPTTAPVSTSAPPSTSTTTTAPPPVQTSTPSDSDFCYGVNLGGWLILETFFNPDMFTGAFDGLPDQWSFDQVDGAGSALEEHWRTYIDETTIKKAADAGINCLRIPIGFWAYDKYDTVYYKGTQDAWLEKAIGWAKDNNMRVLIDMHGNPGSQNGQDHSGHKGLVEWQKNPDDADSNLKRSIAVLETIAQKYGTSDYADVVMGIQLSNEPATADGNTLSLTQSWTKDAYAALAAINPSVPFKIVMHDAWVGSKLWESTASSLGSRFALDIHEYQLWGDGDSDLDADGHIQKACGWGSTLAAGKAKMPIYVGEWTPTINICVDGTCQGSPSWSAGFINATRWYTEAQMATFEANTNGYFLWTLVGPGSWGFLKGIETGIIPQNVRQRSIAAPCG